MTAPVLSPIRMLAAEKGRKDVGSRPSGVVEVVGSAPAVTARDGEAALDTLGAVLRAMGAAAFDVAELDAREVKRLFERWSEHVLVAAPLEAGATASEGAQRHWGQLRQLFAAYRKRESSHVVSTITNLRDAVWSFVEIVNRAAAQDKEEGAVARERLARLRVALDGTDVDVLRREVAATADVLEGALAEQQKRQNERLAEFAASVRTLGEQLEGAKREAALDALTRLPNRASFDEFLERTVRLTALLGRPGVAMMIDIDRFKSVNDDHGHLAGDATIKAVGDSLVRTFPRRGDMVARFGGDEFAIVLRDAGPDDARTLARRVVEAVRAKKVTYAGGTLSVTVSVGLAVWQEGDTAAAWLARADAALYRAKAAGRDGWAEVVGAMMPAPAP